MQYCPLANLKSPLKAVPYKKLSFPAVIILLPSSVNNTWGDRSWKEIIFWHLTPAKTGPSEFATMTQLFVWKMFHCSSGTACRVMSLMTVSLLCTATAQAGQSFELMCAVAEVNDKCCRSLFAVICCHCMHFTEKWWQLNFSRQGRSLSYGLVV